MPASALNSKGRGPCQFIAGKPFASKSPFPACLRSGDKTVKQLKLSLTEHSEYLVQLDDVIGTQLPSGCGHVARQLLAAGDSNGNRTQPRAG